MTSAVVGRSVISPLAGLSNNKGCQHGKGHHSTDEGFPVYRAVLPNGKRVPLLKTLLTTACERNCNYCSCRSGRDFQRYSLSPMELAEGFMSMVRAGIVDGVFLSSGISGSGVRTQDRLLESADILRNRMGYRGYIHLKLMPGSERDQVEQAMRLSDRVSINLEAPTSETLGQLAPQKKLFDELLQPLHWVDEIRKSQPQIHGWNGRWPSTTTQFVVGAGSETDRELLRTTDYLHRQMRLARAYFSAFRPVPGTPFQYNRPTDSLRKHRLYQAAFLLRDYHYSIDDISFTETGNLSLVRDPKMEWANAHLIESPLEINRADYYELLRIPGIGPRYAKAIIGKRRKNHFYSIEDLRSLGIMVERAAPYILVNGKRLPRQLSFW